MASEPHPSSTTIPANTPATPPPPSKPPQPPPSSTTTLSRLHALLLNHTTHLARSTDRTLLRLSTLLANPASTDALLATTSYTITLLHALSSRLLARRLATTAAASKVNPGGRDVATILVHRLAHVAAAGKTLSAVIDDYRIFVRLWGVLGLYVWTRGLWNSPSNTTQTEKQDGWLTKDGVQRAIVWAQISSLVLFQVLENAAYLSSKGVLNPTSLSFRGAAGQALEAQCWLYSCRFWAVFVALELVRLGIERWYRDGVFSSTTLDEKRVMGDGEKEAKLLLEERKRKERAWWRDLVSNLGYMPLTLHWSVEGGLLGDLGVGVLGAVAGGALLVDAWGRTG